MSPRYPSLSCIAIIFIFLCCPVNSSAHAQDTKINRVYKHFAGQYAGNIGLVSVGVGRSVFNNTLAVGLFYGYLPASINGVEVHTIAIKSALIIFSVKISREITGLTYGGIGAQYAITRNTYIKHPEYYPNGYYSPEAIHLMPFIGAKIRVRYHNSEKEQRWVGWYTELGTLDDHIYNVINHRYTFEPRMLNLAFGVSIDLL
ncbi:MAG: hypothetical protein LWX56_13505 [Ignavibacteria bacterium]|nr:hypothetical protein [Ignavibacteria bacterium]